MNIKCQRCGTSNPVNRVFCLKCGTKLDLQASVEMLEEAPTLGEVLTGVLKSLVGLVLVLSMMTAIALPLWPVLPRGQGGGVAEFRALMLKAAAADNNLAVTEAELNALFLRAVATTSLTVSAGACEVKEINALLQPDRFVLDVVLRWKVLTLSLTLTGRGDPAAKEFHPQITAAHFGHFPLPAAVAARLSDPVARAWQNVVQELPAQRRMAAVALGSRTLCLVSP